MTEKKYTNRQLAEKYFHSRLRVVGDFDECREFTASDTEISSMSSSERETFFRRKNAFFTAGRHNGLDGSVRPFAVGGSDVGTIFGVGMKPPSELYEKKRYFSLYGNASVSPAQQELFDTGHLAEPYIRGSFERLTGKTVIPWEIQAVNSRWPHCVANVDGLIIEDGNIAIYEGKCPQNFISQKPWKEIKKLGDCPSAVSHVPMTYRLQVWFYLAVYELPYAYICGGGWGFSKNDIGYVRIDRLPSDKENQLMSTCEEFVENTAKGIRPSNVDFEDKKRILESFSEVFRERTLKKKKSDLPDKALVLARTIVELEEEISSLEERLEEEKKDLGLCDRQKRLNAARASLAEIMYDCESATCEAEGKVYDISYAYGKRCGFDRKLCEEKYPEIFKEVYRQKNTTRSIRVSVSEKEATCI